jgi:hypothetical protein
MQQQPAANRVSDRAAELAAACLLLAALLFGGGPRGAGDVVVHLAALPCLALGIVRWRWQEASRWQRWFLAWWLMALAVVALQLLPLPPALFAQLPHRASVLSDLHAAGVASTWRPMTLDTWATVRALLALATFGATWLLASTLSAAARVRLLYIALAAGAALALLGFAQAAAGEHAPIRFYAYHHQVGAIGTFANRNHFATLLGMLLPLAFALGVDAQRLRRGAIAALWFGLTTVLWLAAALTYSRAGFALASAALVAAACVSMLPRAAGGRRRLLLPALVAAVALLAIGHYAWDGLAQRLTQDPLDDLRWQYVHYGLDVMRAWLPWGSGLGSFPWVYAPAEPVAAMLQVFAERAHNDLLQLVIEAGVPGLLLLVAFLDLAVRAARSFLMGRTRTLADHGQHGVIAVALAVPLLHSLVDYPLRTLSIIVLLGLLLSLGRTSIVEGGR